ncbi:MAG: HdeA/HdeB family chaperone [Pseudomonadota bacterium]
MKKMLALLTLSLFLAIPTMSQAEDIAAITCADYAATENQNDKLTMIVWIDGFLSAEADVTITGAEWFGALFGHMESYCAANPSATLIAAAQETPEIEFEGEDMLLTPCAEIMADASNVDEVTALLMWSDGYLSSKSSNTVFDEAGLTALAQHIYPFCGGNPDKTLGDALAGQSK